MIWPWSRRGAPVAVQAVTVQAHAAAAAVPHLATVLRAIATEPRTPAELARLLGSTPAALEGMLQTLYTGGYVQQAVQGEGACACGPCSLRSLCRNADSGVGAAAPLHLLRLTPRAEAYLARGGERLP